MNDDIDELAADRVEERGFAYLSKVLRGTVRAPDWLMRVIIDGPSAHDNVVMKMRANAEKYRQAIQQFDDELKERLSKVDYEGVERRVQRAVRKRAKR